MIGSIDIAEIGFLLGDPARAAILAALMDGRAQTAKELAFAAGITAPTASAHLARLTAANLLEVAAQGRHRYFRIVSPLVASMVESVMAMAAVQTPPRRRTPTIRDRALADARFCYDHLAGRLGVTLLERLRAAEHVLVEGDGAELTEDGARLLGEVGLEIEPLRRSRRIFCRCCLDWSERLPHLGGAVGAALATHFLEHRWIERQPTGRAVTLTPIGSAALNRHFAIDFTPVETSRPASLPRVAVHA
ncbi:transcriptional regulator, ArsR family [Faunimonas pinastri]|uniref:Transcriptional regulator, ArsR family n=1 Tax=Faunimonas pinastri TaxID=1855383 RepID=A0A1H9NTT5_9HYPH|nr:winged helix-turn-helix domain-containing protein [Faunimonas pinastri]SER39019.1 transcriptional regulator, ArsR family [Faunimonas pinastri]